MPMTLAEMRVGMADRVTQQVVDIFIRESEILEMLPFDNCISPSGGSTLTYGYVQKKLPSPASFRAINTEYTPGLATVEDKYVNLKVFGGSFDLDRVLDEASGNFNNSAYQMREKIISTIGTFHNAMINGDVSARADEFDGLDKFLVGQTTEYNTAGTIDLSTMDKVKANADVFYEALLKLINSIGAHAIMCNGDMKSKIQTVARILGYKTESEEAFGRTVTTIGEGKVRIIDLKNVVTAEGETVTEKPIIGVNSDGLTDIFGVKFSVADGFHGVTLTGDKAIKQFMPDFKTPGAVKKGEVEMVAAVALKNIRSAGVLRNVKIL